MGPGKGDTRRVLPETKYAKSGEVIHDSEEAALAAAGP
jgi:hypothetical protein